MDSASCFFPIYSRMNCPIENEYLSDLNELPNLKQIYNISDFSGFMYPQPNCIIENEYISDLFFLTYIFSNELPN